MLEAEKTNQNRKFKFKFKIKSQKFFLCMIQAAVVLQVRIFSFRLHRLLRILERSCEVIRGVYLFTYGPDNVLEAVFTSARVMKQT